jgi:hypothetical protein
VAKNKKAKSLKVPKRIAGVKVPKEIRKPVNKALKLADDPQARGLAVAALTAAAAALTARPGEGEAQRALRPGEPGIGDRADKLADAVIAAALEGARRLLGGLDASAAPAPRAAGPPKRGRASARPGGAAGPAAGG